MTEDASAGRLYLEVVADTTGLRADIRTKVEAATRNVKAKVELQLDAARLRTEAKQAAKLAKVTAKVEFDRAQIRRELATKVAQAARDVKAKVSVEVDDATARAKVAAVARGARATVGVDADTGRAEAKVEAMRRTQSRKPITLDVRVGQGLTSLGRLLIGLSRFPAIASGILVAAGAVTNLAGAGFAAVASMSQVVGLLAAVPNLAGIAAQGLAALLFGFSGIGEAVKGLQKAEQAGAATAASTAAVRQAAAERVQAAQERLRATVERLHRVQVDGAQRVSDAQAAGAERIEAAERREVSAHEATRRALERLNQARDDAIARMADLRLEISGGALDEEAARLSIERAQRKLAATLVSASATDLDKREADLELRQAEQRLAEVAARQAELRDEQRKFDRDGVEGAEKVAEARREVVSAQRDEAEAAADVAKAQQEAAKDVRRAQQDAAQAVADARREVLSAQRDVAKALAAGTAGAAGQSAAMRSLGSAMAKLSPAGRRFARFVDSVLIPRMREMRNAVQEAVLPPLQKAVKRSMPLLDTLQKGLVGTGKRVGSLALDFAALVASKPFRTDVGKIMGSNNRALTDFGKAGIALTSALRHVAVVAGKTLVEPFAKWVRKLSESADAAAKTGRETGKMARFFERSKKAAKQVIRILKGLGGALLNLGAAATPSGDNLLERWADGAEHLREVTADPQFQQRLRRFFEQTLPLLEKFGDLMGRVVKLFGRLAEITGGDSLDSLFWVLNRFVDVLELITKIPGGGAFLATLLTLSGLGLGIGLVATGLGGIVKNIGKLAKFTGVGKLTSLLGDKKTGKKSGIGALADDVDDLTGAIDRELPKDARKSRAVGDIGTKAHDTSGKAKDLGKKVDVLGDKAEVGATKSRKLSGALKKVGGFAAAAFGSVSSLVGVIPGLGIGGKDKKADGADVAAGAGSGESKPKKGRAKKILTGVGKGGGVAAGILALLFGEEIADAISGGESGTPRAAAGGAFMGLLTGGGIGSLFGPVGTVLGGGFGAGFGAVSGGGGNLKHAAIGSMAGLPGLLLGGFSEKLIPDIAAALKPKLDAAKRVLARFGAEAPKLLSGAWTTITSAIPQARGLGLVPGLVGGVFSRVKGVFEQARQKLPEALSVTWRTAVGGVPVLGPIVTGVSDILGRVKTKFGDLKAAAPALAGAAWGAVNKTVPSTLASNPALVGAVLGKTKDKFTDLKTQAPKIAKAGWTAVQSTVGTDLSKVPPAVGKVTGVIPSYFKSAVDGSRTNFAKLQPATASPIRYIADRVFDGGLAAVWNAVASRLPGLPPMPLLHLKFAAGGITPGYSPGRDIHRYFSTTGGVLDLSGGEGILRPELTRVLGADFVHGGNAAARKGGIPAVIRWLGGVGDPGGIVQGFASGGIFEGVKTFISAAKDFFPQGIKTLIKGAVGPLVSAARAAVGGNPWGNAVVSAARLVVDKAVDFLVSKDSEIGGPGRKAVQAARSQIGVPYSWGGGSLTGPSYGIERGAHTLGFDCSGLTRYAWYQALHKVIPRTTTTLLPWLQRVTGTPRAGDLGFPHSGHVWMYTGQKSIVEAPRTGLNVRETSPRGAYFVGRPPASFLADSGGPLPPGRSIIDNLTGANEWILTPEAVRMLGGEKSVAALNRAAGAAGLYHSSRSKLASAVSRLSTAGVGRTGPLVEQHIHPQPRQSEHEIAMISNRKLGVALG